MALLAAWPILVSHKNSKRRKNKKHRIELRFSELQYFTKKKTKLSTLYKCIDPFIIIDKILMVLYELVPFAVERSSLVGQLVYLVLELRYLLHFSLPTTLSSNLVLASPSDILNESQL